jgi:hypothetical protein
LEHPTPLTRRFGVVSVPQVLVLLIVVIGVLALLAGFAWATGGRSSREAEGADSWSKDPFGGSGR